MLSLCDVDACGDDVIGRVSVARQQGAAPCNQPLLSMPGDPTALIVLREKIGAQNFKNAPEAIGLLGKKKKIPDTFTANFFHRISGRDLTGRVESQNTPFVIKDNDQCSHSIQDG